ncbi:MAG: sigma-54 dependent transcriptional regulator [Myxococcota bacterium]
MATKHHTTPVVTGLGGVRVVALHGPDAGRSWELPGDHPGALRIGTGERSDVQLTDPYVSRRHLELEVHGDPVRVVDLDSTNGTYHEGARLIEALVPLPAELAIGETRLRIEPHRAPRQEPPSRTCFGPFLGESRAMNRIYPLCERLAKAAIPVVIEGETGTGKEAMAEALHAMGPRAEGPFIVFDCTVIPHNLMEAELFGHERGAFTGATAARQGVVAAADGGTLLLDEIGDLDLPLQAKLLRAIDRHEIRPVGAAIARRVNVRFIAATRRNLDRMVEEGRFRDDLYHRLAVGRISLPPLRRRRGDVALLARTFWTQLGGESSGPTRHVLRQLEDQPFPGNVRELRNHVARILALGDLADAPADPPVSPDEDDLTWLRALLELPLKEARQQMTLAFERRYVRHRLAQSEGNVTHAAAAAGVARRYFQMVKARSSGE